MKRILTLSLVVCCFISCSGDCQKALSAYRQRQCSIIVEKQNLSGRTITLNGRNSKTGKEDKYRHEGGWYVNVYKLIEVGDTVIKRKNEMIFYIHKKDTTLTIPYDCQGKIYK